MTELFIQDLEHFCLEVEHLCALPITKTLLLGPLPGFSIIPVHTKFKASHPNPLLSTVLYLCILPKLKMSYLHLLPRISHFAFCLNSNYNTSFLCLV